MDIVENYVHFWYYLLKNASSGNATPVKIATRMSAPFGDTTEFPMLTPHAKPNAIHVNIFTIKRFLLICIPPIIVRRPVPPKISPFKGTTACYNLYYINFYEKSQIMSSFNIDKLILALYNLLVFQV